MSQSASGCVLLIGGHVRSGTTLVRGLCNAHPDIAITHEFMFFSALERSYSGRGCFLLHRYWKRVRHTRYAAGARLLLMTRYLWRLRMHHDRHGVRAPAVEATLRDLFPCKRIVGDKTPFYVFQLATLTRIPRLSLLIVLRDARDVVSSTLERVRNSWGRDWQNFKTPEALAHRWVRSVEEMEYYRKRVHVIRYEELVREPERQLQGLAAWLDVDPRGFQVNMVHGSSVGKYQTGLTRDEIDRVMQIAGPAMAETRLSLGMAK